MKNSMKYLKMGVVMALAGIFFACSTNSEDLNAEAEAANSDEMARRPVFMYKAELNMLNNSGVWGMAELMLDGDQLTVTINAQGLVPDMGHAQHIHGFTDNFKNSSCPPDSADTDGDGLVSVGEGLPYYGPVLVPLSPFTTAPGGIIDFQQTYTVDSSLGPLQNRSIVLHGLNVNGAYVGSMPVACGQIVPNQGN